MFERQERQDYLLLRPQQLELPGLHLRFRPVRSGQLLEILLSSAKVSKGKSTLLYALGVAEFSIHFLPPLTDRLAFPPSSWPKNRTRY